MISSHPITCWLNLSLIALTLGGCQLRNPEKGLLEEAVVDAKVSSYQLQVLVADKALRFAGHVEVVADRILAEASDPEIRRNALLWKIHGISACFRTAMRQDALAAYLDMWILTEQMATFFESPAGRELFGPWQENVVTAAHLLDNEVAEITVTIGMEPTLGESFVNTFARDYPITCLYFERESLASRYIERVKPKTREVVRQIGSIDQNFAVMRKLMSVYAEHLPKQARWQAELLLLESASIPVVAQPLRDLAVASHAIARIDGMVVQLPELMRRERQAVDQIVVRERTATLAEVDRMREETLRRFEQERAVVLAALQQERAAVTEQLHTEVTEAFAKTDHLTRQRASELAAHGETLIDYFFRRLVQLVLLGITAFILLWLLRRTRALTLRRGVSDEPAVAGRIQPPSDPEANAA